MTVFVYGFVACIVKLDDAGLRLTREKRFAVLGRFILAAALAGARVLGVVTLSARVARRARRR